jgi:tetratricopeptide (TPR) repeat protein
MRAESLVLRTVAFALLATASSHAADKCKFFPVAQMPVTMAGLRPLVDAQINGKPTHFVLDSGSFFNIMSPATAAEYELKVAPFGMKLRGIGGDTGTGITAVEEFGLMGLNFRHAEFLVSGSEVGAAGVIGQNLLSRFDVEYDLAKGTVHLFRAEECDKSFLAYWTSPGQAYSSMDINKVVRGDPHTIGKAYVNGKSIRAMFDTGASVSAISLKAAEHAGVKVDSPGVVPAGLARGFGRGMVKQYIAVFASFKVGDGEEIKNTRLRVLDSELPDADMLIGADFFLSHHILVSNSQRKLYLTYNGGPVFNLTAAASESSAAPADAVTAQSSDAPQDAPGDAADYERRGAASVARHDFEHGLADLSKAIELNPAESEYYFRRAMAYRQNDKPALALADLDHVLTERTDFIDAYIERADLRLRQKSLAEAIADLDAADHLAPAQADLRLRMAGLYSSADAFAPAIAQLDLWIPYHPQDSRFAWALVTRCLVRALQNQQLEEGLADCDRVSKLVDLRKPDSAGIFANRGMVRLRQGEYAKAIDDFDDALKRQPKYALALYGRGVAKSRQNQNNSGEADIDAAEKLAPNITSRYRGYGFSP